jgi:membrane associated rhomboid family serine protease
MPANINDINSPSSSSGPPESNPVLTAYESYVRDTPLVTRYVLNSVVISYFMSFIVDPTFALGNIPYFTLFRFQLYRIVTSPLVCSSILNLFFAFMGFMNNGVKLEQSMGSALFGALFFKLTIFTNLLFLIVSILLYGLTNNEGYLAGVSVGVWTALLSIIAVECAQAPPNSKRKLFFLEIPVLYYPLVLLALFSLFAGFRLSYCLGVAVGYLQGFGKLDRWKVKVETARKWESERGCLRGFYSRAGYISVSSASGPNAWAEGSGGGGNNENSSSGGPGAVRAPSDPAASSKPSFPSSGGQSLGGGSKRGLLSRGSKSPKTKEERAALLERAAERRRQQRDEEGDSAV